MKIRTCFVSNSSSSSCVCELCGRSETGMDLCISDAEMFECVNGHIICQDESVIDFAAWIDEYEGREQAGEDLEPSSYEVPEKYCPFCCMHEFTQKDLAAYLQKKHRISRDEAFSQIKAANKRRKKLYDAEYVMYVLTKTGERMENLIAEIKDFFPTYKQFKEALK